MKNKKRIARYVTIIAAALIMLLVLAACIEEHEHSWGEWIVRIAPTCEEGGEDIRICKLDSLHNETRPTLATGHNWGDWVEITSPTCVLSGVEERTCKNNSTYTEQRGGAPATGHQYTDWEIFIAPTETEDGEERQSCIYSYCEDYFSRVVYPTGTIGLAFTLIGDEDGYEYKVTKGTVNTGHVVIPAFYRVSKDSEYFPVTLIDKDAFKNTAIISVTIPADVTFISEDAFSGCFNLTDVIFAENSKLEAIEKNVFFNCGKLVSISIPTGVKTIGASVFENCILLSQVIFEGNAVTSIGSRAFHDCEALKGISLPSIETIEADTFSGTGLVSIAIPASVKVIGIDAFSSTIALATVTFAANSELESIMRRAFEGCVGLRNIQLPATLKTIGNDAFRGCTGLTSVTFAEDSALESIGNDAFRGCTHITRIIIPASVLTIGSEAFGRWAASQTIEINRTEEQADLAWGADWRGDCFADIVYLLENNE